MDPDLFKKIYGPPNPNPVTHNEAGVPLFRPAFSSAYAREYVPLPSFQQVWGSFEPQSARDRLSKLTNISVTGDSESSHIIPEKGHSANKKPLKKPKNRDPKPSNRVNLSISIKKHSQKISVDIASECFLLLKKFGNRAKVLTEFQKIANGDSSLLKRLCVNHLTPSRPATAKAHLVKIRRFLSDLSFLKLDVLSWSIENIFKVFCFRQNEETAATHTFQGMRASIRYFGEKFGVPTGFDHDGADLLDTFIRNWFNLTCEPTKRSNPIFPADLAKLEAAIILEKSEVNDAQEHWRKSDVLWAWIIRLMCGAGIRWDDLVHTIPSDAEMTTHGITACATQAKNRARNRGRPWACSNIGILYDGWLEKGFALFKQTPNFHERDFWIQQSHGDDFNFQAATWDFFSKKLRFILTKAGVEPLLVEKITPHGCKASLMSLAVFMNAQNKGISKTELQLLGAWSPETVLKMAEVYSRDSMNIILDASRKVMENAKNSLSIDFEKSACYDSVTATPDAPAPIILEKDITPNARTPPPDSLPDASPVARLSKRNSSSSKKKYARAQTRPTRISSKPCNSVKNVRSPPFRLSPLVSKTKTNVLEEKSHCHFPKSKKSLKSPRSTNVQMDFSRDSEFDAISASKETTFTISSSLNERESNNQMSLTPKQTTQLASQPGFLTGGNSEGGAHWEVCEEHLDSTNNLSFPTCDSHGMLLERPHLEEGPPSSPPAGGVTRFKCDHGYNPGYASGNWCDVHRYTNEAYPGSEGCSHCGWEIIRDQASDTCSGGSPDLSTSF